MELSFVAFQITEKCIGYLMITMWHQSWNHIGLDNDIVALPIQAADWIAEELLKSSSSLQNNRGASYPITKSKTHHFCSYQKKKYREDRV